MVAPSHTERLAEIRNAYERWVKTTEPDYATVAFVVESLFNVADSLAAQLAESTEMLEALQVTVPQLDQGLRDTIAERDDLIGQLAESTAALASATEQLGREREALATMRRDVFVQADAIEECLAAYRNGGTLAEGQGILFKDRAERLRQIVSEPPQGGQEEQGERAAIVRRMKMKLCGLRDYLDPGVMRDDVSEVLADLDLLERT